MKTLIALSLLAVGAANAATTVEFSAASSCPTYCTGFTTDNEAYSLDWLNAVYANSNPPHTLLSVNGATYSGNTTALVTGSVGTHTFYDVSGSLQASNGSTIGVDYKLEYWTTRVVSGRDAGHTVAHRMVDGGTFTLP
jgi:hypothetical protein